MHSLPCIASITTSKHRPSMLAPHIIRKNISRDCITSRGSTNIDHSEPIIRIIICMSEARLTTNSTPTLFSQWFVNHQQVRTTIANASPTFKQAIPATTRPVLSWIRVASSETHTAGSSAIPVSNDGSTIEGSSCSGFEATQAKARRCCSAESSKS
jgi:hypothetical protein